MEKTLVALIPAYKPEPSMITMLQELKECGLKIVVVNDGSGTEYEDIFKRAEEYAHIIYHDKNMGKGHALKTGMSYIKEVFNEGNFVVVTMDADGQHMVSDALKVCS